MSFWRLPSIYVGPIEKCDCDIEDKNKYMRKYVAKSQNYVSKLNNENNPAELDMSFLKPNSY